MRGTHNTAKGHLLAPAIIVLAAVAVAIPGSLSRSAVSDPMADLMANVSVRQDVSQLRALTRSGACGLARGLSQRDPLPSGLLQLMLRLAQGLDHATRDASQFIGWVERLLTTDGLNGLDVLLDGVVAMLHEPLDPQACPPKPGTAEPSGQDTRDGASCHA